MNMAFQQAWADGDETRRTAPGCRHRQGEGQQQAQCAEQRRQVGDDRHDRRLAALQDESQHQHHDPGW